MTKPFRIYLSPPAQNGSEAEALNKALQSNWLAPVGPQLSAFENALSAVQNNQPVLALNSGTAAIHLALKLCEVGPGDEVLVATHTHNASVNPIIYCGATPVFVDSEAETWNMSPKFLADALADRVAKNKKPKAILVVHLYGLPAKMDEICALAKQYALPVIEDAAEALGSTLHDKPAGSLSDFGVLSFNGNKIITTSGGGALVTQTQEQRDRALFWATQARDDAPHFQHSEIGYNYRLSNVLAALGTAQLHDLNNRIAKRREIFNTYKNAFAQINQQLGRELITTTTEPDGAFANRWLSTFLVKNHNTITAENWRKVLLEAQIESRPLWKPMHLQPVFADYPMYGNQTSDRIFAQGICLPSGHNLSATAQSEIIELISKLYKC